MVLGLRLIVIVNIYDILFQMTCLTIGILIGNLDQSSRSKMLLRTFGPCLSNVKQHLFMTYCGSMYTTQLWCTYTKKQHKKIIVAYNNVFHKFLGYDRYCSAGHMFVESRVETFNVGVRRIVYSFWERIYNSENNLIKCIVNSTAWKGSDLFSSWNSTLYM